MEDSASLEPPEPPEPTQDGEQLISDPLIEAISGRIDPHTISLDCK